MTKILGIIPARYESQRLPQKVLREIGGKPMIQRVYEQCIQAKSLNKVLVAVDDQRIFDCVQAFGGEALMTSDEHPSGTDRCAEVASQVKDAYPIVINIQGDQPFIEPAQIDELAALFDNPQTEIATLAREITSYEELIDDTEAKIALDQHDHALYMSRSPIPYLRGFPMKEWPFHQKFYKHVGIYGFKTEVLIEVSHIPPSPLELSERLEQLRWLSYYKIKVGITQYDTFSVDTPEDLDKAEGYLSKP